MCATLWASLPPTLIDGFEGDRADGMNKPTEGLRLTQLLVICIGTVCIVVICCLGLLLRGLLLLP